MQTVQIPPLFLPPFFHPKWGLQEDDEALGALDALALTIYPFDVVQARRAGLLRRQTRQYGLSLGDRACVALAVGLGMPAMTADQAWTELDLEIEVTLIR